MRCCCAGAYGCTISGAGPTCVAVLPDEATGKLVTEAMADAFRTRGKLDINAAQVVPLDNRGARKVSASEIRV